MKYLKLESHIAILSLLLTQLVGVENNIYAMPVEKSIEMKITENKIIENSLVSRSETSRLERIFLKVKKGENIVIATIGGSITEGAYATKPENRYANIVAQWFKDKFGDGHVEFVNAGIGATGSGIGSHRVEMDILNIW